MPKYVVTLQRPLFEVRTVVVEESKGHASYSAEDTANKNLDHHEPKWEATGMKPLPEPQPFTAVVTGNNQDPFLRQFTEFSRVECEQRCQGAGQTLLFLFEGHLEQADGVGSKPLAAYPHAREGGSIG
jgi:hypothetical protein